MQNGNLNRNLKKSGAMKIWLFLFFCIVSIKPVEAQTVTKTTGLSGFSEIEASSGVFDIRVEKSDSYSVEIECDESLFKRIGSNVSGSKLVLEMNGNNTDIKELRCIVRVRMPELKGLDLSGANIVKFSGKFETSEFRLRMSGATSISGLNIVGTNAYLDISGACRLGLEGIFDTVQCNLSGASSIKTKLKADTFGIDVSGAGLLKADLVCDNANLKVMGANRIDLSGATGALTIDNTGASGVDTKNLQAKKVTIKATGVSSTTVRADETLDANLSGVCRAAYTGSPRLGTIKVGKLSSLTQMN